MKKFIVAGNWKMNKNNEETKAFFSALSVEPSANTKVVVGVPFPYLQTALHNKKQNIAIAAQNAHPKSSGAFTGEVSFAMLKDLGVEYCIIGHSERRAMFAETDNFIAQKVDSAIEHGILPILCVGETLEERYANKHFEVVTQQLLAGLINVSENNFDKVVIAYEPVWAIGTGQTATSDQAQEIHAHIRAELVKKYGKTLANNCAILYGGSCKPDNAEELFSQPDVNGGLIGGASLKAEDFISIIHAAK